jgi:hypothetical protein
MKTVPTTDKIVTIIETTFEGEYIQDVVTVNGELQYKAKQKRDMRSCDTDPVRKVEKWLIAESEKPQSSTNTFKNKPKKNKRYENNKRKKSKQPHYPHR